MSKTTNNKDENRDTTLEPTNHNNQSEKKTKKSMNKKDIKQLEKEIASLASKLEETEQIAKKAQADYIHIKLDFDAYIARTEQAEKTREIDSLINVVKKFLPFINSLRQSLDTIPKEEQDNSLVQWVQLVYKKFISSLEQMNIYAIESIWLKPDIEYHEAVSTLPTQDKSQKWLIVQEFEQWFYYKHWDIKKVVTPAKVAIWQ